MRGALVGGVVCVVALAAGSAIGGSAAGSTRRTVYVTVVDSSGKGVAGLTAADFDLKEGGKEREIISVDPAKERYRLALLLDTTLAALGGVRVGMAEFAQRMSPLADIALIVVTHTSETVVDYTSDLNAIVSGIKSLTLDRTQRDVVLADAVMDAAKKFQKTKSPRSAIVVIAAERDQVATIEPQVVMNEIAKSGAVFSAVTTPAASAASTGSSGLGAMGRVSQIFDDGAKQAGGRRIDVLALTAFSGALQQIADDLSNQYLITYTLPDGVKPADRLAVTLKKPGLTLRAPIRIPK